MIYIPREAIKHDVISHMTGTTGHLHSLPIPVASLSEQQNFTTLVEKVESLPAKQRETEKELENLFDSLMQRVFKEELFQ